MNKLIASVLAAAISLPLGSATCQAESQQDEIDALKQEVARLTRRVEYHDTVNGMVQKILAQVQETLSIQVQLNTVQSDINALVRDRLR